MKIVADDKIPFLKGALEPYADVVYISGSKISRIDLKDADALLIRTRTKCNESLLKGSTVKFIGTATIGYDHIDTVYCDKNGIKWTNAPGCNSSSVQQYITAVLLKIANDREISLKGRILGIVGAGSVGSKVEKTANAFGMKTLINDPPRERKEGPGRFVSFDTVLRESDIITLHVPLNRTEADRTFHMFSGEIFSKLGKKVWFINSSRGEVVETASLKNAVRLGLIEGAVIDVWENEPDIDTELLSLASVSTPHIAGYSTDGKANGTSMIVNSLSSFFGLPLKGWYPSDIPQPEKTVIDIDCKGRNEEDIAHEIVKMTYDVGYDDKNLRNTPGDFEKLRGNYRVRREFTSFRVVLKNSYQEIENMLKQLGFNTDYV